MRGPNLRAALAEDPAIGAGNVLVKLIEHGAPLDGPGITFDLAVDGHPAWTPFTLGQLRDRVAARAQWLAARGIGPRDPVAVYVTSAADCLLSFMALTWLGAIPALMNGNMPGDIAVEFVPAAPRGRADHRRRPSRLFRRPRRRRLADLRRGRPRLRRSCPRSGALPARGQRPDRDHAFIGDHADARGRGALARQPVRRHPAGPSGHGQDRGDRAHAVRAARRARGRHHQPSAGPVQPARAGLPVGAGFVRARLVGAERAVRRQRGGGARRDRALEADRGLRLRGDLGRAGQARLQRA